MSQLHGVETIELTSGTVAVTTIQTAIIGLVGTAPDASGGTAASGSSGTPILDNVIDFTATIKGREGNVINVAALAGQPAAENPAAVVTSASWDPESLTLKITLGCDEHGVITAKPGDVAEAVGGVDSAKVSASGRGDGIVQPFSLQLARGEDEPFPLNTPVAVVGTTLLSRLGEKGTLKQALTDINDQRNALTVVVRVADENDVAKRRAVVLKGIGTPAAVKIAMDNANARLAKERNGADIPNVPLFLQNLGLVDVLFKGDGRFLAGTFVSDAIDRTSIGARAATGCQFMRAHQAPDAPDQVSYWQVITLTEVVSPTSVVDVLAISGNNVVFGHGTGAGITSWRHVAMLEGAAFTGDISASNVRGGNSVTIGDGTGGLATGGVDGAGFNGNNMNVKSWDGIGFQNAADLVIRAYISTKLGIIAASESVYAGSANLYKNGDVYGDKWSTGNGPNWLSLFLEHLDSQIRNELTTWTTNNFPTKSDVSAALSLKPGRQYITQIGVYQNDKSKPFMLHDDDSGIFLAPSSSVHLDANGWHRDASTGLITQWGSGNVAGGQQQRVNFPMTFPNTCVTVVANDIGSGTLALSTISKDTGGFTVKGSSTIFGFNWLSMGY
ncbi:phage tail protein [Salmonella enterica]|nr:phage tail protein [Salmonella enterica]